MNKVIAILLAVLMLFGMTAPAFAQIGAGDTSRQNQDTLLDQILRRDGFIDGIWFPWLNGGTAGHSLSGNEVMATYYATNVSKAVEWSRVELDYIGADAIYRQIYNLKAMGYNMMAWGGSIYAEGVQLDLQTGDVLGIKEDYLANARRLLDICREVGMPVMWNVYFHSSSMPAYYGVDGWNIVTRMAADNAVADRYAELFVRPLCRLLAEYPDVVAMVSIADEPENEINDVLVGDHFSGSRAAYGVNREDMLYLLGAINNVVRQELPHVARTIASNNTNKSLYADFALDLMGHNRYDNHANMPAVEEFKSPCPAILSEYNVGGDARESDDELTAKLIQFRQRMMEYGYQGGLQWCWLPGADSAQTSYYLLASRSAGNTDFRATVTDLRHYMDEYRATYRGETIPLDAPVLYANGGTGLVEWIPSQRGVKMDLLRSVDGGASWTTVLDNVNQSAYINARKKGVYQDTATPNAQYKIVVRDTAGHTAESAPNHTAEAALAYKQPYIAPAAPSAYGIAVVKRTLTSSEARLISFGETLNRPATATANLITNGSFEGEGGPWNTRTFLNGGVTVVKDATAPDGGKSLYFDSSTQTVGDYTRQFTVPVQNNTDYVFSVWVKGDYLGADNKGHAGIGVVDPDTGKFMVYYSDYTRASREDQQIYPTAWDNEWHLRSVKFNSGSQTAVTIALYGYGSRMWLDDMALFENGMGVKYVSEQAQAQLQLRYFSDPYPCNRHARITENSDFEADEDYWDTAAGWDAGFLSVTDATYGKALHYTAHSGNGQYYIQWVDVEPYTEYAFAFKGKILQSGDGFVGLLSDCPTGPEEAVYLPLDRDTYGEDWFDFYIAFNTSGFNRVGIAVCDLGGEALIDDLCLFPVEKAAPEHSYSGDCDVDCDICGETRPVEHTYDNEYDPDCNGCGAMRDVPECLFGDANGDGKVNVRDLGCIQQYLNGRDVEMNPVAADVNGDGKVNVRDLGLIQQYLNGWDVTLGTP